MNIAELIEILNKSGEQTQIEAKTATEVGKSILESICAFANEPGLGGGVLVLGVQPEKLIDDLVSQCRTVFNHPLSIQIHQENLCEKEVVAVTVAEANNGNKPIYFKSQGLPQGAFRRIGCSDVRCTEDDLLVLYQQREFESFDYTPLFDADLDDIDTEAVEDYRKSRAEIHPNAEELHWNDQELLQALGCARKIKQQLVPTVAGILLFGTTKVLRRLFPVMRVDYIRVQGTQWVGDSESRFTSLEARGPMMSTIRRVLTAIVDDLPKAFSLPEGEIQRQDIPIVPSVVIREAVVNALMHRNYRANQSIQIIRYSNRLEIRNPGYSLISDEHLGEPGSKSRNLKIAEALHETRFAEVKGSGIRIMRENMLKAGLSPPLFESDRSRFIITRA